MLQNANFHCGPLYLDMNIGNQVDVPLHDGSKVRLSLWDAGYGESEIVRGDCMDKGLALIRVADTELQIGLGQVKVVDNLRIGLNMLREYSTGPWHKKRQNEIWKLEHSARFFVCDGRYPLVPKGSHIFPIVCNEKWNWDRKFYNHYARKCRWELTPIHEGADIACSVGIQDIVAAYAGEIFFIGGYKIADQDGSEGIGVFTHGDDNVCYLYFHLDTLAEGVKIGCRIETGQVIGVSGNSGFERTQEVPHLHFQMWLPRDIKEHYECDNIWEWDSHNDGFPINPEPYLIEWYEYEVTR